MGLNVVVRVSARNVAECLINSIEDFKFKNKVMSWLEDNIDDRQINMMPGGYGGLYRLRADFIELKKLDPEPLGGMIPKSHYPFHLLNLGDSDGWYLPNYFEMPVWVGDIAIGSSKVLLSELEELGVGGNEWLSMYIATVASISTLPILFT